MQARIVWAARHPVFALAGAAAFAIAAIVVIYAGVDAYNRAIPARSGRERSGRYPTQEHRRALERNQLCGKLGKSFRLPFS
jgi:hypothetical protein